MLTVNLHMELTDDYFIELETQNVLNKTAPYKSLFDCNLHMELTDDYFIVLVTEMILNKTAPYKRPFR
jgi:hypothetical protein